jgi:hypothetical protein
MNKNSNDSVHLEPYFEKTDFKVDSSELKAEFVLSHQKYNDEEAVEQSVWDEVSLSPELAKKSDAEKLCYSTWLDEKINNTSSEKTWLNTFFLVLFSGIWAIVGVFVLAIQGRGLGGTMAMLIIGPVIEEILKISSVLVTIEKKPYLFKSSAQIFICCAMSGLLFAFIENLLYLKVYIKDPSELLVIWRWTICMLLHATCASISSIGLIKIWERTRSEKKKAEIQTLTKYITLACVVHGLYNLIAILINPWIN